MAGTWDPTNLPVRPGLYANFVEAAIAQIVGGTRGTVAIPLANTGGSAATERVYEVNTVTEATDLFGADNIQSIKFALQAGANKALVYTLPTIDGATVTEAIAYADAFEAFEARQFNVFVFDVEVEDGTQDDALTWCERNKDEGKHFTVVFGGDATADQDPSVGNSRTTRLASDYAVNLISGGEIDGTEYTSAQYAPYIAGLIAGTRINASITYAVVPVDDVTKRLTNSKIKTALQAGSLVLVHDGEKVKVEQGLTTSGKKIRTIRARQAISTDVSKTAADNYIGKIDNNEAGQNALIGAISAYLENLENNNVLTDISVGLDPENESVGDQVFLAISFTEVDSMEKIFLTINV